MEETTRGHMIRLTGLWVGKNGIVSGSLSPSARLVIMPAGIKKSSSDPDFVAYIQAPLSQEEKPKRARKKADPEQQEFWWQK